MKTVPPDNLKSGQWECARCGHGRGKLHNLKIWPTYFRDVRDGKKSFELRKNDRGFECGDTLILNEWDPETGLPTGDWVAKHVASIITKHEGLAEGYVLMGLVPA